jgi:hypothetical protein
LGRIFQNPQPAIDSFVVADQDAAKVVGFGFLGCVSDESTHVPWSAPFPLAAREKRLIRQLAAAEKHKTLYILVFA